MRLPAAAHGRRFRLVLQFTTARMAAPTVRGSYHERDAGLPMTQHHHHLSHHSNYCTITIRNHNRTDHESTVRCTITTRNHTTHPTPKPYAPAIQATYLVSLRRRRFLLYHLYLYLPMSSLFPSFFVSFLNRSIVFFSFFPVWGIPMFVFFRV